MAPTLHPDFNDINADLTIQSSDEVQFKLKRQHLSATTGVFPGVELEAGDEITYLTEHSSVLAILFQYTRPQKHPDMKGVRFSVVAGVAEAAEKYEVFAAMNICQMRMRKFLAQHPAEILTYAIQHDYPDLVNDVLPLLARADLVETLKKLPTAWTVPWVRYHVTWETIFDEALQFVLRIPRAQANGTCGPVRSGPWPASGPYDYICQPCLIHTIAWVLKIKQLKSLQLLRKEFAETSERLQEEETRPSPYNASTSMCHKCSTACKHMPEVAKEIEKRIKDIPPFEKFL